MSRKQWTVIKAFCADMLSRHAYSRRNPPVSIPVRQGLVSGVSALVADELVAQGATVSGDLLASRGFDLYRFSADHQEFQYFSRVPVQGIMGQLLALPRLRHALGKDDLLNCVVSLTGTSVLQAGGWIWTQKISSNQLVPVFQLRHWGLRSGRGILHQGLCATSTGRIVFGEYFNNPKRCPVRLYFSDDDGENWDVLHEFDAGEIRHIHAIVEDPHSNELWVCAGDSDTESRILRSVDGGRQFEIVGTGSQLWRCCSLVCMPDSVYWGVDTERNTGDRYVVRYDRMTGQISRMHHADGAIELGCQIGQNCIVFATIRMGYGPVPDDQPSLLVGYEDRWKRLALGNRIDQQTGAAAGSQLYYSSVNDQLLLSFTNINSLDGKIAILNAKHLRDLAI